MSDVVLSQEAAEKVLDIRDSLVAEIIHYLQREGVEVPVGFDSKIEELAEHLIKQRWISLV